MTDFGRIESELLSLTRIVNPESSILDLIMDFIGHNEFGLALSYVGFGMYVGGREPSEAEIAKFRGIAEAMFEDPDRLLRERREAAKRAAESPRILP